VRGMNKDIVAGSKLRKLSLLSATTPERDNRKMIQIGRKQRTAGGTTGNATVVRLTFLY
jgi:hypothetical protein